MKALFLGLFALTLTLLSPQAFACSCMELPPIREEFRQTTKVAIAKVVHEHEYEVDDFDRRMLTVFSVKKVYKGDSAGFVTIDQSTMTSCYRHFAPGQELLLWLVPAEKTSPGQWHASPCGRTTETRNARRDIQWLERNARRN